MVEALFELERTLRAGKDPLTLQEANVLMAWRAHAMRDFTVGLGGSSIVTWLATQRLRNLYRFNLTLGVGVACGLWRLGESVQLSTQHILSLKGSRIQRELANVMLKKYHNNPWVMQHLSKHFYAEKVYGDSSGDRPMTRWRYRNFSGEPFNHSESAAYGKEGHSNGSHVNKHTLEPKQVHVNAAGTGNATDNPFDLIFGHPGSVEKASSPVEKLNTLLKKQMHKEKRSMRRQRRNRHRPQEESIE